MQAKVRSGGSSGLTNHWLHCMWSCNLSRWIPVCAWNKTELILVVLLFWQFSKESEETKRFMSKRKLLRCSGMECISTAAFLQVNKNRKLFLMNDCPELWQLRSFMWSKKQSKWATTQKQYLPYFLTDTKMSYRQALIIFRFPRISYSRWCQFSFQISTTQPHFPSQVFAVWPDFGNAELHDTRTSPRLSAVSVPCNKTDGLFPTIFQVFLMLKIACEVNFSTSVSEVKLQRGALKTEWK